jgi:hypothetical protein
MCVPKHPKIYHIVHEDRLLSIIADGYLWCDAEMLHRPSTGTRIGMDLIKQRRLKSTLASYPDLHVGDCVPFYFCPRSVMLYLLFRGNHQDLEYRGGQEPIIHLEADLYASVDWARQNKKRWSFTLSNAGSLYFEAFADLSQLDKIKWNAVHADQWSDPEIKEGKQAEFLMEHHFPWTEIQRIGVNSEITYRKIIRVLAAHKHRPIIEMKTEWYY